MNGTETPISLYPIMIPTPYNFRSLNCYLLQEEGSVSLVDSGFHSIECWEALTSAVAANGFSLRDIDRIILTHSHPDHTGLANRIATLRGIPVYAHCEAPFRLKRDTDFQALRIEFFNELYQSMGCGEDGIRQIEKLREADSAGERIEGNIVTLDDGDTVAGLKVIATPGHAPDHIVLYHPRQRWLLAGDLLISHMACNALIEPDRSGSRLPALNQYAASLNKILYLDVETAYPGHGEPIYRFRDLCMTRLNGIYKRAGKILRCVASGIAVPRDIALAYYKELYQVEFYFVMSEVVGYLDYLEQEGQVRKERINGVWHYSATCQMRSKSLNQMVYFQPVPL